MSDDTAIHRAIRLIDSKIERLQAARGRWVAMLENSAATIEVKENGEIKSNAAAEDRPATG